MPQAAVVTAMFPHDVASGTPPVTSVDSSPAAIAHDPCPKVMDTLPPSSPALAKEYFAARGHTTVLAAAMRAGILRAHADDGIAARAHHKPAAMFYDLSSFESHLDALIDAFPRDKVAAGIPRSGRMPVFLHTLAMKANPLPSMLDLARTRGFGCECASINEVRQAVELGFPAKHVVFDSPAKTRAELELCLMWGVHINVDNLQELAVLEELRRCKPALQRSHSVIGIRINPLSGGGTIKELDVACMTSKFGVAVLPRGASADDTRLRGALTEEQFLGLFAARPWLCAVHVHAGSQGITPHQLARGVGRVVELAARVNTEAGRRQVTVMDIGGGLGVNFESSEVGYTWAEYVRLLRVEAPALFSSHTLGFERVVTEFGRSVHAKCGWFASAVQNTRQRGELVVAVLHAGADLFVRNCYKPASFHNRVEVFTAGGVPRDGRMCMDDADWCCKSDTRSSVPDVAPAAASATGPCAAPHHCGHCKGVEHNFAGPLCFSGDLPARGVHLPFVTAPGDIVVLHDTGAYCLSQYSAACSRDSPAVYAYRSHVGEARRVVATRLVASAQVAEEPCADATIMDGTGGAARLRTPADTKLDVAISDLVCIKAQSSAVDTLCISGMPELRGAGSDAGIAAMAAAFHASPQPRPSSSSAGPTATNATPTVAPAFGSTEVAVPPHRHVGSYSTSWLVVGAVVGIVMAVMARRT